MGTHGMGKLICIHRRCTGALKVLPQVGTPEFQALDQPRRNSVAHVSPHTGLVEVLPAGLVLAFGAHSQNSELSPLPSRRAAAGPLPVHSTPTHLPFLRAEPRLATQALTMTVGVVTPIDGPQHSRLLVSTMRTSHDSYLCFCENSRASPTGRIPTQAWVSYGHVQASDASTDVCDELRCGAPVMRP